MYFPFIRGKSFDFIAIREVTEDIIASDKVIPIIEPVKKDASYTYANFETFVEKGMPFILTINPTVGEFADDNFDIDNILVNNILEDYDNYILGFIISNKTNPTEVDYFIRLYGQKKIAFIFKDASIDREKLKQFFSRCNSIEYLIFDEKKIPSAYISDFNGYNRVVLNDPFVKKARNASYSSTPEPFDNKFNSYQVNGFVGFSDYTAVGGDYQDGGFAPYAVALHYTYLDDNELYIRHFTSDSNDDIKNVQGKYSEALAKMIKFIEENEPECGLCLACEACQNNHSKGHYPGLGTAKKLSIQHHIMLMICLLKSRQ